MTAADAMNEQRVDELRNIFRWWIEKDRENIIGTRAKLHWVCGPESYNTNQLPDEDRVFGGFYWNRNCIDYYKRNLARAATALRLTLEDASTASGDRARVPLLDELLSSRLCELDRLASTALRHHLNRTSDTSEGNGR